MEFEDIDSHRIDGGRHCIAEEMIKSGMKNGRKDYHSCGSSDALSVYQNDPNNGESYYTGYCYSCSQAFHKEAFHSSSHAADFGVEGGVVTEKKVFSKPPKRDKITREEITEVLSYGYEGKGERGLLDDYNKFFGHITKLGKFGEPKVRFYPETKNGKLVGYKSRTFLGKKFGYENKGLTGIDNDLSGQVKFEGKQFRDILIVGGECFLPSAEVMTDCGWKTLKEVVESKSFKVLQVNDDNTSELVNPIGYIEKEFKGDLVKYENKYINSITTPNHNLVSKTPKGVYYKHNAVDGPNSKQHRIDLVSKISNARHCTLSNDQLALIVAIAADSKVDERKTKEDVVHFSLQKLRKRERLEGLLSRLGIESRNFNSTYPDGRCKYTYNFELPSYIIQKGLPSDWLFTLTEDQRLFVLKELTYWDGNFVKDRDATEFSSKLYHEADLVRNLAKLSGLHASLRKKSNNLGEWYAVLISWTKVYTTWQNLNKELVPYEGRVYCVTVPSGMLMVKQGEKISVTGNCDKVAFYQQFCEYQKKRNKTGEGYLPMPVVSPTTGEGSAIKQIRNNYDFINTAERIFLGLDADECGIKAMNEIAEIFPREKVFIVTWSFGDPNAAIYNKEGKDYSAQTIRDFYNAKPYYSNGIVTSQEADSLIEEELLRPKMTLPDFMYDLQKKMAGGIPLGYIVNWIAETGIGKSTLINEAIRHWVYTSPYKIGILSLELTASQYMIAMLSREVGYKINLIEDPKEAVEFVRSPKVVEARKHLSMNEHGESRFAILDERDGDLEQVKVQCELLINKYGCKVIIIDPIQDLFEGVDMEQQNSFLKWMKTVLKKGVTFNNVCHVRKGGNSTDKDGKRILRELNEDSVHGISAIVKSSGANIFATRDKYDDCDIRKNITYPTLGKCRWTGNTGRINNWYYDLESHTMYDLKTYAENNKGKIPAGFDFDYDPFDRGSDKKGGNFKNKEQPKIVPDFMDNVPL
jgi:archaellum biogenesis ATPase FlaH